jgi:hypothetical protein
MVQYPEVNQLDLNLANFCIRSKENGAAEGDNSRRAKSLPQFPLSPLSKTLVKIALALIKILLIITFIDLEESVRLMIGLGLGCRFNRSAGFW